METPADYYFLVNGLISLPRYIVPFKECNQVSGFLHGGVGSCIFPLLLPG